MRHPRGVQVDPVPLFEAGARRWGRRSGPGQAGAEGQAGRGGYCPMRYRAHKNYRPVEWVDALAQLHPSPISGQGLFARALIKQGEVVVVWGGVVFTQAEL